MPTYRHHVSSVSTYAAGFVPMTALRLGVVGPSAAFALASREGWWVRYPRTCHPSPCMPLLLLLLLVLLAVLVVVLQLPTIGHWLH